MVSIIRTIIIDDEIEPIDHLARLLQTYDWIQIEKKITDTEEAFNSILDSKPSLLFLDIQMPGMTGFELVYKLWKYNIKPDIIFVTAFNQYAIQAIRMAALDYLIKPVIPEELEQALLKLKEKRTEATYDEKIRNLIKETVNSQRLKISTTGGFTMVNPKDIIHIQADWNYAEIFYNKEKSDLVTINIGSLEKILPTGSFFRISRSEIINTTYLTKVSRKKRLAFLNKDGIEYTFKIPLLRIRALERFLEK
jgi:two-component system, LytTR family, response regulator